MALFGRELKPHNLAALAELYLLLENAQIENHKTKANALKKCCFPARR